MSYEYDGTSLGQATVVRKTDRAVFCEIEELGEEKWIPNSVIHDDSEVWSGCMDRGELIVKTWFAEKEGLV